MMHAYKARVRNGRLVLDEPTDLPEGAEVDLVEHAAAARTIAAIEAGLADAAAGRVVDHDEARLRLETKFGRFPT